MPCAVSALCHFYGAARTEELLAATALLNDLNKTWLELLDGRHVAGEDTHLSRLGWDVHLYAVLPSVFGSFVTRSCCDIVRVLGSGSVWVGTYTSCDL